jgi:predicted MFS family arabinose efflux permease
VHGRIARIAIPCVATYVLAIMAGWLQPAIIEGLRQGLALSRACAGEVAGAEVAAVGIGSMLIGARLHRLGFRLRTLGIGACCLIVVGNLLSIVTDRIGLLLLGRAIAGCGQAIAFATATNILATRIQSSHMGRVIAAYTLSEGVIVLIVPHLLARYEHRGVFALMGGLALLLAPIIALFPSEQARGRDRESGSAQSRSGWLLFAGSSIWATVAGMVWAFSFELGQAAGLTFEALGIMSSLCVLGGAGGGFVASILSVKTSRIKLLWSAISAQLALIAVISLGDSPALFVISLIAIAFATYFCYPLLLAIAGDTDPSGALSGRVAASFYLGGFAGPILGGVLLMWAGSFAILAVVAAVSFGPILALIGTSARKLPRKAN